jgi:hypothetical protein
LLFLFPKTFASFVNGLPGVQERVPAPHSLFEVSKDLKFHPKPDYEKLHTITSLFFGECMGREAMQVKMEKKSFDINNLERKMSPFTGTIRNIPKDMKKIIRAMLESFVKGFSSVTNDRILQAIISRCLIR